MKHLTPAVIRKFHKTILNHYEQHGRSDLPWRRTDDSYQILVSEVMLQQTQVSRVSDKFGEFVDRFPDFESLAAAPLRDVLTAWSGLGYNRRARYLKQAAEIVVARHSGRLPAGIDDLVALPGIGPATARAIAAFAFDAAHPFIETNIRSVYIHFFFRAGEKVPDSEILPLVERTLPAGNARVWYNALMDYGAMLKQEYANPSRRSVHHVRQTAFEGSNRQVRGAIIKALTKEPLSERDLKKATGLTLKRIRAAAAQLEREGLIARVKDRLSIA
jgi:A/G-specific adenine glycosylase